MLINTCTECGQVFETKFLYKDICESCMNKRERRLYKKPTVLPKPKRPRPCRRDLAHDIEAARRQGMSYGEYISRSDKNA